MPADRSRTIEAVSRFLGVSGEVFIQCAIDEYIRRTIGAMVLSGGCREK
jgi:hypothetical protein